MSTENERQNQDNGFWFGLIVGAAAAGLAVYLLDKDKEEQQNLIRNLKAELTETIGKIKELLSEREVKKPFAEKGEKEEKKLLATKTNHSDSNAVPVNSKPKKFFKKNGKKLH